MSKKNNNEILPNIDSELIYQYFSRYEKNPVVSEEIWIPITGVVSDSIEPMRYDISTTGRVWDNKLSQYVIIHNNKGDDYVDLERYYKSNPNRNTTLIRFKLTRLMGFCFNRDQYGNICQIPYDDQSMNVIYLNNEDRTNDIYNLHVGKNVDNSKLITERYQHRLKIARVKNKAHVKKQRDMYKEAGYEPVGKGFKL